MKVSSIWSLAVFLWGQLHQVSSFMTDTVGCKHHHHLGRERRRRVFGLWAASPNADDAADGASANEEWQSALESRVNQIQVENTRTRLEDAHTQSFLKRRPRKLPYEDARVWVQANLGCDTEEEFYDLVDNGNLRTPYIPKQPERYYTETREWVSWSHFLHGCFDDQSPSAVKPSTGVFD